MTRSRSAARCRWAISAYDYFSISRGREGAGRRLPAAVLDEGAAGEPAALRGRPQRHRRPLKAMRAWLASAQLRAGDRLPPGARADAGLHRRAGGGRSGGHARRHGGARRRPAKDQSAGPGRPGHRPLGAGRFLRQPAARSTRNVELEYERNGERYAFLRWGPKAFDNFRVVPAGHRHLPSGQSGVPVAGGLDRQGRQPRGRLSRTRWSAPTATPRWSTAWRCWAGAWAASRPRPRCWASRSRC